MKDKIRKDNEKKYLLMSLREEYFSEIAAGKKLYEYRTKFAEEKTTAFIYVPKKKEIVGIIEFDKPIKGTSDQIAKFAEDYDKGDYMDFYTWLDGRDCYALPVLKIITFKPLSIEKLKERFEDFSVPQSYYYLNKKEELLDYLIEYGNQNYENTIEFEQELKILCSEVDFFNAYNRYVTEKNPIKQVNYYFDKDFVLHKQRIVLRIREKNGSYTLTIKKKENSDIGLSLEKSETISKEAFEKIMKTGKLKVEDFIKTTLAGEYEYIGSLETIRDEIHYKNTLLSFDINRYFDKVDYEIEMEGKQKDLIEFYKTINLSDKGFNSKSKISRFIDEYKKING